MRPPPVTIRESVVLVYARMFMHSFSVRSMYSSAHAGDPQTIERRRRRERDRIGFVAGSATDAVHHDEDDGTFRRRLPRMRLHHVTLAPLVVIAQRAHELVREVRRMLAMHEVPAG